MRRIWMLVVVICAGTVIAAFSDELTPEQRREFSRMEDARLWSLQIDAAQKYDPSAVNSACGNGDFEGGLLPAEWSGGHGVVDPSGNPNLAAFTGGLFPGLLTDMNAHQTLVPAGLDPNVGISTVAPTQGSTQAVRIGNAVNGAFSELLSKTFVVTPATSVIRFSYAVVLEDPGHPPSQQPSFWVRVVDSNDLVIPGAVDLGNGSDKAVADASNPFFQNTTGADGTTIVYRDWSCAEINLSSHIGKTVTVQFIIEDCTQTGHYAYGYVDNFCGLSCGGIDGTISFSPAASTNCGVGKLCFDYTLPQVGTQTGTIQVTLDIFQNGSYVTTLNAQKVGTQYCVDIDQSTISGLSAGSFDWIATANFAIGATQLAPKTVNSIVDNIGPYQTSCNTGCCPGPNLVKNGDFEAGNVDFTSAYANVPPTGPVLPGQYAVMNSTQASGAASSWNAQNPSSCSTTGKFLVVNGATGQSGGFKVAWSQAVPVVPNRQYRLCVNLRNLPQCAMDVKPRIDIRVNGATPATAVISQSANGCDWKLETRGLSTSGSLFNLEILLDESSAGDGNDLAIDNISLQELLPASPAELLVNIASSNVTTTTYNITATPPAQPHNFVWDLCEVNTAGNCVAGTQVSNGWTTLGPTQFPGYIGTSIPTGVGPGVFQVQKKYRAIYTVFGECTAPSSSTWYFGFSINARTVVIADSLRGLENELQ